MTHGQSAAAYGAKRERMVLCKGWSHQKDENGSNGYPEPKLGKCTFIWLALG